MEIIFQYQFSNIVRTGLIVFLIAIVGCSENEKDKGTIKNVSNSSKSLTGKVIYGDDNRHDIYQEQDWRWRNLADSTAALVFFTNIDSSGPITHIKTTPFKNFFRTPLCETERFVEQETAAFCSGFLVAPNLIATAGHCIQTEGTPSSDCSTTRFVFGFSINSEGYLPKDVPTSEIYSCKRIIAHKLMSNGADYSIVEIDRPVTNHTPLKINRSGQLDVTNELTVIGHPSGLPTKISDQGHIRYQRNGFFRASLDTYGGNSGSAVLNSSTGEVEGILVRGEADFESKGNCMASKVCKEDECRGEDVTSAAEFAPFIGEGF